MSDLEVLLVASGILMERHHLGVPQALHRITEAAVRSGRDFRATAYAVVTGHDDEEGGATEPEWVRAAVIGATEHDGAAEAAAVAVGVLVERHRLPFPEAAATWAEHLRTSGESPVVSAWRLVNGSGGFTEPEIPSQGSAVTADRTPGP
ncbi:ANTAR domain-containing protein [Actinomycetospora sp. TBRC 11914]|uniref:ANTAR domain-containing protein n=1 Tax=Actinomycetospora sp. TBRC 11914 TaxID=2729387 RepID=UPI00145DFD60|nr:ANTAR domain-containing protein [Actinomycetospora sp. TBRC 11914]NMO88547.1 ANTAR domain-containing protein [Actinomycetospora sp. TBRC 11914]